jgi:hypothetical protein
VSAPVVMRFYGKPEDLHCKSPDCRGVCDEFVRGPDFDQLAAENAALRDALQSLRTRLQACVAFYVHEAYDSFYQELVDEALSPAPAKKEGA